MVCLAMSIIFYIPVGAYIQLIEQGYEFIIHSVLFVYIIIPRAGTMMATSSVLPPTLNLVNE